jgi:voltage-gated potassium channel Kch
VFKGDPGKISELESVAIDRCKAVIVALKDNGHLIKTVRTINKHYPDIPVAVRADDLNNSEKLKKIGATIIVPERYEAGLQLAGALLAAIGMSDYEVSQIKNEFRENNYELIGNNTIKENN